MQSNNQNLEMLGPKVDPAKKLQLQTLLREISEMENREQRYLAHAILQTILFSMEQYCEITYQVTENCINDGPSDKPIEVKSLIQCMQAKNANPFSTMRIQPETLYFMRYNGYNDLIQDNRYSQGEYPNFNTYETIYTNALEGIAQGNLDIFSSLPQEIQNVVGEYKDVLLRRIAERNAYISLLIRIDESTTSEELTVIFEEVKKLNDYNLFAALINKSNDPNLLIKIASYNHTEAIHNAIFYKAKNFSSDSDKSTVFKALIENSNDPNLRAHILEGLASNPNITKETQNQILELTETLVGDDNKSYILAGLASNPNIAKETQDKILAQTIALTTADCKSRVFSAFAKNNMNHNIFEKIKAFDHVLDKVDICIQFINNDTFPKDNKFIELIQLIDNKHCKKILLSEILFSAYNANINNKEGFKDRLQTYVPMANADETFRIIQLMASSRPTDTCFIFIGYDKPLEAFHRRILYDYMADPMLNKIQNAQNNSNTFANIIQNQNVVGGQGMNM